MTETALCALCKKRRPKRACPAVQAGICTLCCGQQREVTLSCPLDCVYLREAHKHEKPIEVLLEDISHREIEVTEDFIRHQEELLLSCVHALVTAALRTGSAVDTDVLEALAAMIQTRHTAASGLIYETVAANPVAAGVQQKFLESIRTFEAERNKRANARGPNDADMLKLLVFLHRIGQQNLNGRPKGRMFIDMLRAMTPDIRVDERAPSIIL